LACLLVGVWNAVKPLPPGTHTASVPTRLPDSEVELLSAREPSVVARQVELIDKADQLLVLDQSPLPRVLAQALLLRKHQKPKLKIIVITDPKHEVFGGTPARDVQSLERAGIIVVRVDLERLRDANPVYSGFWRVTLSWFGNPFEESPGEDSLLARAREFNHKADRRQVLVGDDGSGGYLSILGAVDASPAILIHGAPARDVVASELKVAAWSADEDRLPALLPPLARQAGTIDVRVLSEGAIGSALLDGIAAAVRGDTLRLAGHELSDRRCVDALIAAATRGARIQVLLDAIQSNHFAADDLLRGGVEIRWQASAPPRMQWLLLRHQSDALMIMSTASLTRRDLADFNLANGVEMRMPDRAVMARSSTEFFATAWLNATPASVAPAEKSGGYWLYRLREATGF
jgi:cardiolipin synthase